MSVYLQRGEREPPWPASTVRPATAPRRHARPRGATASASSIL